MTVRILAACLCSALWAQTPQAQFEQAAVALRENNLARAEAMFAAFVKSQPRHIGGLGNLGVVYSRQGRPAKAAEIWERALAIAPGDPGLRTNLGLAYLRLEEYRKAVPVLEPVRTPQGRELLATGKLFSGDAAGARAILADLPDTPGVLYLIAVAQLRQGQKAEAAATFDRLVNTALSHEQVSFLRGKAYYEAGAFEEAIQSLNAIKTDLPGLALERGKVFVSLRDAEHAEAALRHAIRETPLDSEANYFLGALLVQQDRAAEGAALLEIARASRPNFWGTHFYLGRAGLSLRTPAKAVTALEKARALNPAEPQIEFQLAKAYTAAQRPADAKAALARFQAMRESRHEAERQALVMK